MQYTPVDNWLNLHLHNIEYGSKWTMNMMNRYIVWAVSDFEIMRQWTMTLGYQIKILHDKFQILLLLFIMWPSIETNSSIPTFLRSKYDEILIIIEKWIWNQYAVLHWLTTKDIFNIVSYIIWWICTQKLNIPKLMQGILKWEREGAGGKVMENIRRKK